MTLVITHTYVSAIADSGDATVVQPSNWNANHTLTGSASAAQGGTGFSSYAVGDVLYADTTSTLAKLADVATGNALISGGVNTAPSYGKIGLTTHISGILAATNGGTGQSTYVKGDILVSPGSNLLNKLAVGADGFVLTADAASTNGVKWSATGASGVVVDTTTITGGTTLRLLYDNAGTVGETAGITFTTPGQLTIDTGTITASKPALTITQTFNNAGVTFSVFKIDITGTSAGGNLFLDFFRAGVSKFQVDWNGFVTAIGGNAAISMANGTGFLFGSTSGGGNANSLSFGANTGGELNELGFGSGVSLKWSSTTRGDNGSYDIGLYRDAAGILAQRLSTTAQAKRIYNTFTDASNYERGGFDWITTANTFRIRSENAGTGTNRIIAIDGFDKAGAAANTDLPSGTWALIHDTSGATVKLVYNLSGTLKTVALV